MASRETFKGYGPEQGYDWLRHAIAQNDFRDKGLKLPTTKFLSATARKCDCGGILDILGAKNKIAISDPVYPVYVDTNVMAGHTGEANEAGAFTPNWFICRANPAQRFHSRTAEETRGRDLSLLAEQSDRRGGHARTARGVGEIRAGK
jgi:aspartate/methionine/tyrosine aminotransferase